MVGKNAWYVAARVIECNPESSPCRWGIVAKLLATHIGIFCFLQKALRDYLCSESTKLLDRSIASNHIFFENHRGSRKTSVRQELSSQQYTGLFCNF
jgi:hypothetical protein